jgi:CBS domain-containing protein
MKTLKEVMTKDCITVTMQDNVYEIAVKMKENDIGFIPVVDEERNLLGVVTDRDLVIRGYAERRSGSAAVEQVISKDVTTVSSDTSIEEAAKLMAQKQIRRLPIVENGKLQGVVAIGDLAVYKYSDEQAGKALSEISESDRTLHH